MQCIADCHLTIKRHLYSSTSPAIRLQSVSVSVQSELLHSGHLAVQRCLYSQYLFVPIALFVQSYIIHSSVLIILNFSVDTHILTCFLCICVCCFGSFLFCWLFIMYRVDIFSMLPILFLN
uniref:Uncharacterized protein n=1 Tax=Anguilla anguilla TaxID=7936 RepID=A0A0E9X857_ANGAN